MIIENKYTRGFRPKFGDDVDDNGYLVPCEKEQSIIRLMKILKRENTIPANEEIIRYNICNVELQLNICDV